MNNITPSGTNGFHGSADYRFRRKWLSSRSFNTSPALVKAPNPVDDFTLAIGGPVIKNRWFFYGGYEKVNRDFSGRPAHLTTINAVNQQSLIASGLPSDIFVPFIAASQKVNFFIFRTDAQLTKAHRLTGRIIKFSNFSPNNIGGLTGSTPNTLQRTQDLDDKSNSLALQLASILSPNVLNEFLYQRAHRKSDFYNFFAQDDWKVTRKLKLNYGLRYDLYDVPEGDRNFKTDKNNFAPRLRFVYSLREGDRPIVIRGSAGIYYDTVYLAMYENAIQGSGTGRYLSVSSNPSTQTATAPLFPNVLPSNASLTSLGIAAQDAQAVSPDFENTYAMHIQTQIEQAVTNDISVTAGYIHSEGRFLPVYRQINFLPTGRTLADGRPVYSSATRVNPNFNTILQIESAGNSHYNAFTLQLNKRFSQGYLFSFNYTLSRVRDNAPERNLQGVGAASQSDPSNRNFDLGYGVADQRHTFSGSFVARPSFNVDNKTLRYILNNNQFGFTAFAGSGETFPITTNFDLNGDGIGNDIPVGLERNAGRAPGFVNVDFRYSRVIPITERFRIELVAEATNIFNINSTITYGTGTTLANTPNLTLFNTTTGVLASPIDYSRFSPTAQEGRQGQLGIKFVF